jgi:hypothetical protein
MDRSRHAATVEGQQEVISMQALSTLVVFVFVLGVVATVGYALFAMSPFAEHRDRFRDPRTGRRLGGIPRLD